MHRMMVIPRVPRREVQNLAPRARLVRAIPRTGGLDRPRRRVGNLHHPPDRLRERIATVPPGRQHELPVAVEVDERPDPPGGLCQLSRQCVQRRVLRRVPRREAAVRLPAGIGGGAALGGFGVPLEDPVAVSVCAEAGRVEGGPGLAVLAPQAVRGLGVDEAVGVVEGDEVEVVVV